MINKIFEKEKLKVNEVGDQSTKPSQ